MSEDYEEEQGPSSLNLQEEGGHKVRPPNKKKYDEDMEKVVSQIKEREGELEKMKSCGSMNISSELRNLKVEKSASITKRKQIDTELEKLKKVLPEKMHQLGQLESSLIYKSEDKINAAIQRLEWNLKVQPFKLMEEKKIVSEIDRLKRSKKTLVQYLALKQEIAAIRDVQRGMREERDGFFKAVGKLTSDEDKLRRNCTTAKTNFAVLKSEIDDLYENKRQLVANYKKQVDEYQGAREKQQDRRKGSWRKREDFRKSAICERKKLQSEPDIEKTPYEKYISWCNSLIKVLSRYNTLALQETSVESLSPASSVEEPELAEEIDDGQYILLKKGDSLEQSIGAKRPSKKNRKLRKQSSKKVTLSPDMVQQLSDLGLKAPNSVAEVSEAIERLRLKKIVLEQEQQSSEVASDAGISATESQICEMSRQASKTESYEGAVDTNPGEHIYAEIFHRSLEVSGDNLKSWEVDGAVGGCDDQSGITSPNSDSTMDGDTGSSESQSSVVKNVDSSCHDFTTPVVIVFPAEREGNDKTKIHLKNIEHKKEEKTLDLSLARTHKMTFSSESNQEKNVTPSSDYVRQGGKSPDNMKNMCPPKSERHGQMKEDAKCEENPTPLSPSLSFPLKQQVVTRPPMASSLDFPSLTPISMSTTSDSNKSVWSSTTDPLRPVHTLTSTSSSAPSHCTLAARLSNSSTSSGRTEHPQPDLQPPVLILDNDEFPSLSQAVRLPRPRRGSTLSTKSSGEISLHQEQLSVSCDHHPTSPSSNQIANLETFNQSQPHLAFPVQAHQSLTSPVSDELTDSQRYAPSHAHSDRLISMSQLPSVDKSSTEKWVESSVAYFNEITTHQCEDNVTVTESTRL